MTDLPIADRSIVSFSDVSELSYRLGLVRDEHVLPITSPLEDMHDERRQMEKLLAMLCGGAAADEMVAGPESAIRLCDVRLHAPFVPNTIFCSGPNYESHLQEMSRRPRDDISRAEVSPYFFVKSGLHTVVGTGAHVDPPLGSVQLDWEVELAVVIGRGGEAIAVEDALSHVAGYSILVDLSARDQFNRADMPSWKDWLSAKSFKSAAPFGPAIVPAHCVGDVQSLELSLWVNGDRKQHGNTSDMVFSVAEQIAYVSRRVALRPGDVISTGSPAGVGFATGSFLKEGDEVTAAIAGVGQLSITIGGGTAKNA